MFKTIVWATDGTRSAERGLPLAKRLAQENEANLVVVYILEMVGGRGGVSPRYAGHESIERRIDGQVNDLCADGVDVRQVTARALVVGVAQAIANAAKAAQADVIVIGTRGRSPVTGFVLGSVTQSLLHVAPCPVLAIPPTSARAEPAAASEVRSAA